MVLHFSFRPLGSACAAGRVLRWMRWDASHVPHGPRCQKFSTARRGFTRGVGDWKAAVPLSAGVRVGKSETPLGRRYNSPAPSQPEILRSQLLSSAKLADTALAGLGLWGSVSLLAYLEPLAGPLFLDPMLASGIIFFVGPAPPNPKAFLSGTAELCI